MMYLIGNSIDIHKIKLIESKIKLGGLEFDSKWKILAYSDGDIILHTIADSIYGALCLGDLGNYFSDKEKKNKNINSILIINDALKKMEEKNYKINNIDITIISEHIFFKEIKSKIVKNLVFITKCNKVNIKATRWEKDTKIIQAHCSVLLVRKNNNERKI